MDVREIARQLIEGWCGDSEIWATHGRPEEWKLQRIEDDITRALAAERASEPSSADVLGRTDFTDEEWDSAIHSAWRQFETYVAQGKLYDVIQRRAALDDALQHAVGLLKLKARRTPADKAAIREECAKVADRFAASQAALVAEGNSVADMGEFVARAIAEAIRARAPASPSAMDGGRPIPFDRDTLGRFVREAWVRWARTQPNPKPSWLVPYDDLSEVDKEADRQIGEDVARWTLIGDSASVALEREGE